ncbi:anaphase-promoting complex subunit 5-like [Xenia sp. Carnegie-2017]|uniref:anaphase-promoting complex subunit 5-like n=1 Tax=Xenia sp. Carnegie-2017 TaxID=2897299 RepID=UPI001F048B46|nr:anaphase-promoting complex subunit 5-like [Xenia sp. Carnegie-2017]
MNMFSKKLHSSKDCITPHKISLLVLICELCDKSEENITPFRKHRRPLMIVVLNFMQANDIEFIELRRKLDEIDGQRGHLSGLLCDRLNGISEGESSLCDFFLQNLEYLLNVEEEIVLTRTSFFGLFVRKMVLLFNKMSFGQVLHLNDLLKTYLHSDHGNDKMNAVQYSDVAKRMPISRKQGEIFLAKQAVLLNSGDNTAENAKELQEQINNILCVAPDLAEAHFVQYLNCIRVGELKQAVDYLYHYFDRKQFEESQSGVETEDAKKVRCKRFCYAALNLAVLHTHFGHRRQALTVLEESIKIAQEANDHVCLVHGLKLLHKLKGERDAQGKYMLERICARTSELKLQSLESLSMLMKTNQMVFDGDLPSRVFGVFDKLNFFNLEKSLFDLSVSSDLQQSSCFHFYGQSLLAAVYSQLPLIRWKPSYDLGPENSTGVYNADAKPKSLCFLANHLQKKGNFVAAMKILDLAERYNPANGKFAQIWQAERARIMFDQALLMEDWQTASKSVENLKVFDTFDSELRKAKFLTQRKQFDCAHETLQRLMKYLGGKCDMKTDENYVEEMRANIHIAMAELYIATENYTSSIGHLLKCKTICDKYHVENISITASLCLAETQFRLDLPDRAMGYLRQAMINALSNGSVFTVCCLKILACRCELQKSKNESKENRRKVLLSVAPTLDVVLKNLKTIHAITKLRDVLILQAFVYNELGYLEKRNKYSIDYRLLSTTDDKIVKRKVHMLL